MTNHKMDAYISEETEFKVTGLLEEISNLLPFLVVITNKERIGISKLSRKMVDFVQRSFHYAKSNPQFTPSSIEYGEMFRRQKAMESLKRLKIIHTALQRKIEDSLMVAESQVYSIARIFYKGVKAAAQLQIPLACDIAKDLAFHFKKR